MLPVGPYDVLAHTQWDRTADATSEGAPLFFIAAVRFGTPVQAQVLLTYGNASQPGSPHNGDQLRLYDRNQLRPAWLTRAEIQAHLSLREDV